ncbi:hypothetical protein M0Q50_02400 [bacterium]|jgi:hypothetical protein|nr:hypothetical protein [bacterium]
MEVEDINLKRRTCFSNKFRIVTDIFCGYEVQIKRWWIPFWYQCWYNGTTNTFSSTEKAKQWIYDGRPKKKNNNVVEVLK